MNLNKLMKQAQKMQEKMAQAQAELAEKTVEVQAAGGKITVVANGAGDVISIKIAKEIVDPEDVVYVKDYRWNGCTGIGTVGNTDFQSVRPSGVPLRCVGTRIRIADKMSAGRTGQRPVFHSYNR